jgi:hypothetical protein
MYTNAIPVVGERFFKNSVMASIPPADAPMPTTGNSGLSLSGAFLLTTDDFFFMLTSQRLDQ